MNALSRCLDTYWASSIGKKLVVAITGFVLVLFLAGHLLGNLVVFAGPAAFNDYAYFLHHMLHGSGIWLFRIIMLGMLAAHILATVALTLQNRNARKAYECTATIQASLTSRTMIFSGLSLLTFLIYHLLHFTARIGNQYNSLDRYKETVMLNGEPLTRHNTWQMIIDGFNWWPATLCYVIAITLLCSHLAHGVGSIFQTLGLRSPKTASLIQQISIAYSLLIWLGFVAIPIAIFLGSGSGH